MKGGKIAVTSVQASGIAQMKLLELEGLRGAVPDVAEFQYEPAVSSNKAIGHARDRLEHLRETLGLDFDMAGNVFCEYRDDDPEAGPAVFAPMDFGLERFFVHARGVDALPETLAQVNLVLGSCLFSNRAVRLIAHDDTPHEVLMPMSEPIREPIKRIEVEHRLTLYELESARRLSGLVAQLAAGLPQETRLSVTLDVPRVQYYCYLFEAQAQHLLSRELAEQWYGLVDERYNRVCRLFETEFEAAQQAIGAQRRVTMRRSEGLDAAEAMLKSGADLGPARVAAVMAKDEVWSTALQAATPANWRELIDLSYSVELLKAGGPSGSGTLCADVENYGERRIYEHAKQLAGVEAAMIGLYPLERIFTSADTGRTELYLNDPGQELTDSATGQEYTPEQLVEQVYE